MVRNATFSDVEDILNIYAEARIFMRQNGNPNQWSGAYPAKEDILCDIEQNLLYVVERDDKLVGVFFFAPGPDVTYKIIEHGEWLSDEPYCVIHRIASKTGAHGVFLEALNFCRETANHIRIDTHSDNTVMQHVLEKNGFSKRGIIYLLSGDERIAYEI
ncbi:MAG: GNAT family N-acetyltransferase, partial [Clostridia bacterium]|nr:GNAT family N-acetyltransferase [Clostridia bacterium]